MMKMNIISIKGMSMSMKLPIKEVKMELIKGMIKPVMSLMSLMSLIMESDALLSNDPLDYCRHLKTKPTNAFPKMILAI
jgi:hypothetical protein